MMICCIKETLKGLLDVTSSNGYGRSSDGPEKSSCVIHWFVVLFVLLLLVCIYSSKFDL